MPPALSEPGPIHHRSFLDALAEYHRDGLHTDVDVSALADASRFREWIGRQRRAGLTGDGDHRRDRVPHRVLWWTDDAEHLGRLRLNLVLNDELRAFGGHLLDTSPAGRLRFICRT